MSKLLSGKLPNAPIEYNQEQFNQIIRKLEAVLAKNVESQIDAENREALSFFLSN